MSTLALLVQWRRSPGTVALPWLNPLAKLPSDVWEVLEVANGEEAATAIAAAATGAPGAELRGAALAFIREVLQAPGATFYRRLGVEQSAPIEAIRDNYRDLISVFHPDRMGSDSLPGDADIAAAINEAYNALKHPESRARYDRLRMANVIEVPSRPSFREAAPGESKPNASPPQRDRSGWRQDKAPNPFVLWARRQSPRKLKLLAFGVLLAVAVGAVSLTTNRDTPTLAIQRSSDVQASASPASLPSPSSHAEALPKPKGSVEIAVPAPGAAGSAPRVGTATAPSADLSGKLDTLPRTNSPVAVPMATSPSPVPAAVLQVNAQASDRAVATADDAVRGKEAVASPSRAMRPDTAAAPPAAATAPEAAAHAAAAPAPRSPTSAEVDLVVARFAQAYDAGDMNALLALFDPDALHDNRIALAIAYFQRVFNESRSRRIDLHVLQVDTDAGRTNVQLGARTTINSGDVSRAGVGTVLLVIGKRNTAALIRDMQYRDGPG